MSYDYLGPDGCSYDSALEAFGIGALGFCGCGDPEGMAELARDYLRWLNACPGLDAVPIWSISLETVAYEDWRARKPEMTDREELLLAYLLDDKGLTEHGGSVYGAWPTDEGNAWLERLGVTG